MDEGLLIAIILSWASIALFSGITSYIVAYKRIRSGWFFFVGFFFGLLGLIIILVSLDNFWKLSENAGLEKKIWWNNNENGKLPEYQFFYKGKFITKKYARDIIDDYVKNDYLKAG